MTEPTLLFCPDLVSQGFTPDAIDAISSAGRCVWQAENLNPATLAQPLPIAAQVSPPPAPGDSIGGWVVLSVAGLIVVGGCIAGALLSYRWKPAPASPLYLLPQGNQTHGIPTFQPMEFPANSHEFAGNSHDADANSKKEESANSHGIPQVSADSHADEWKWPDGYQNGFDPTKPEQPGEFEFFQTIVEQTGLNPKGNDIITRVWGVKPGRSDAFLRARDRRDIYAKRLDYYRSEGYFS